MAEAKLSEAELMAVIEVLKDASAQEQEDACSQLEEEWKAPELAARARELLKAERKVKVVPLGRPEKKEEGVIRLFRQPNGEWVAERDGETRRALKPLEQVKPEPETEAEEKAEAEPEAQPE